MKKLQSLLIKNILFSIAMIGGINWGLLGFFDFEIFSYICGENSLICKSIYIIIGLCTLATTSFAVIDCRYCVNKKTDI